MTRRVIPRPVRVDPPLSRAPFIDPKTGVLTSHGLKVISFLRDRSGGDEDAVWAALGIGVSGLTRINQVSQRVSDVEAATAVVQGAIAGLRGDPRLEDAVKALQVAITALVQVQARASGESEKRIGDLDRLVASLGARLTKASQTVQMQLDQVTAESQQTQQGQVAVLQRAGADAVALADEINALGDSFEERVYASLSAAPPITYDNSDGTFSLNDSLTSLGLTATAANKAYYTTALNTWASHDLSSFGRDVSALADASAGRTLFGLGSLATASTISNDNWSGTDLAIVNGGTGASSAIAARAALGVEIGVNVAAYFAPRPGWTAATGTATRTTFDTATVTTSQLAERVKALIDDLIASETIGA
jgi:hypothetical protein